MLSFLIASATQRGCEDERDSARESALQTPVAKTCNLPKSLRTLDAHAASVQQPPDSVVSWDFSLGTTVSGVVKFHVFLVLLPSLTVR